MKTKVFLHIYLAFILLIAFSCKNENELIEIPITNIEFSTSSGIIEVGLNDTLEVIIHPGNAIITDYTWTSSEPSIAEVNSDGVVRGISPGVAIITVSTKDNRFTASDTVHVIRWTYYSMENVHVRPIAVDAQDNVWCGGIELTRIIDNQRMVYPDIKNISAIAVNNTENRWFGTYNSGVWKYDGTNWINYTESNSNLAHNSIINNSMMLDHKGNLWFGTVSNLMGTGVTMYDGSQWHVFNSDSGLVNNNIVNIAIDNEGNKWFISYNGISSFDGSNWVSYTSGNTGINLIDYAFSIAIDKENNKWFGSYLGALKLDGPNWTIYNTSNDGLNWSFINAIAVDKDDNKWFATEYGVSKFDGTNWINYTSVEGYAHNVRAISIDSKGNKWLGTSHGVIKLED